MWCRSQYVHKRNKSFIRKELRARGITLHLNSDHVARLPAGSLWTVIDVKRVFRKTLKASYIPVCVCDFLLDKLRVIRLKPLTVGSVWTMLGAGPVALPIWRASFEAAQPYLGCRSDMDMSFALHSLSSTLGHTSRLCEPASACCKTRVLPGRLGMEWQGYEFSCVHVGCLATMVAVLLMPEIRGLGELTELQGKGDLAFMLRGAEMQEAF